MPWPARQGAWPCPANPTPATGSPATITKYGHAIADAAWRNLKAFKPEVTAIGKSWWKPGEPDLVPYLTAILAAQPDAVIFCAGGRSMTNVLKAIQANGMAGRIPIWIHTATDHAVLKPLGADAPEGVIGHDGLPLLLP